MKFTPYKLCFLLGLALSGVGMSLPSFAQGHGGGGHMGASGFHGGSGQGHPGGSRGGHGWSGGGPVWWGLGLGLGLGWEAAYFGYPYLDYPYPGYVVPPPVIVEPSTALPPAAAPAPSNWYYCDSAKAYYPYVRECPQPWRIVPAVPPGTAP